MAEVFKRGVSRRETGPPILPPISKITKKRAAAGACCEKLKSAQRSC